jgi:hypothetical protein
VLPRLLCLVFLLLLSSFFLELVRFGLVKKQSMNKVLLKTGVDMVHAKQDTKQDKELR